MSISTVNESQVSNNLDNTEYYALIIGINDYPYWDEEFIDQDVNSMYELLVNSENWVEENIKVVFNENATKQNISENITGWLAGKEDQNDVILIYISGHGWKVPLLERLQGHAFYVPYDGKNWYYSEDSITDKELNSWINKLESEHITIILDHCYAGRMLSLRKFGRVVLAAGGKYLLCPVDGDRALGHGIFTYHLIQGFNGVADRNNDGWVSAEEAFIYARIPTIWFSLWKHFPYIRIKDGNLSYSGPQVPFMYDHYLRQMPLINLSSD